MTWGILENNLLRFLSVVNVICIAIIVEFTKRGVSKLKEYNTEKLTIQSGGSLNGLFLRNDSFI